MNQQEKWNVNYPSLLQVKLMELQDLDALIVHVKVIYITLKIEMKLLNVF